VKDPLPTAQAFEKAVERLLGSPRYGERWGRHWLDVVRYADTGGGSNDYERPQAWRYRDYVIRSGKAYGRDHNPKGMTIWFAGGDVKPGLVTAPYARLMCLKMTGPPSFR
jgi:hypothetical protein